MEQRWNMPERCGYQNSCSYCDFQLAPWYTNKAKTKIFISVQFKHFITFYRLVSASSRTFLVVVGTLASANKSKGQKKKRDGDTEVSVMQINKSSYSYKYKLIINAMNILFIHRHRVHLIPGIRRLKRYRWSRWFDSNFMHITRNSRWNGIKRTCKKRRKKHIRQRVGGNWCRVPRQTHRALLVYVLFHNTFLSQLHFPMVGLKLTSILLPLLIIANDFWLQRTRSVKSNFSRKRFSVRWGYRLSIFSIALSNGTNKGIQPLVGH